MKHLQKALRKPFLNEENGKFFISQLDDDLQKRIAKKAFIDGMTSNEIADEFFYSVRQVERIRISLLKNVLKKLIEKQIPKKIKNLDKYSDITACIPNEKSGNCPICNNFMIGEVAYCEECGQALDWSDLQ